MDQFKAGEAESPIFAPRQELKPNTAPITIRLALGQDMLKFLPYLAGAGAFGVSRDSLGNGEGIYVVKGEVIAELKGAGVDSGVVSKVMDLLGGEFAFRGTRSALYDTRGKTQGALVDMVDALLDKGKVLYILKRNKIYPVSRDFIQTNNEVAKFIDSQAKAIFLEKVEILEYR
jgi:hypothetical protein